MASLRHPSPTRRVVAELRMNRATAVIACIMLCLWGGMGVGVRAEVREVSIAEVMREFCAVVVANEGHYEKAIDECFPNESQSTDTRESCRAVINSVTRVMNEFYRLRQSPEVKASYSVSLDWQPPAIFLLGWQCEVSESFGRTHWSCPGFTKEEVQIASREAICAVAFKAENRIGERLGNARRADRLLAVKALRVVAEKAGGPVVSPEWTINGEDGADSRP